MVEYYDREKLYKEVWEAPMIEVCKRYGVSDVALAKTCKKLKMATPPRGYWALKKNGKNPYQPKLIKYDNPPLILIRRNSGKEEPKQSPRLAPKAFIEAESFIKSIKPVQVSEDMEDLHPFVRNTRKAFKKQEKRRFSGVDYNRIDVSGSGVFKISIGVDSIDRVSLLLHSICSFFILNGFKVDTDDEKGVVFQIMDESLSITVFEVSKKTYVPKDNQEKGRYYPNDYEYIPSGILKLEIDTDSFNMKDQKSWTDGKTRSIEDRIPEIIHQIIRAAAWKKEYVALQKQREEEWRIELEKRAERDRLAKIERGRISQLEYGYKAWMYHKELAEYVKAIKSHYIENKGKPEGDFARWLEWAEAYLERVDPMKGEYPKYEITF